MPADAASPLSISGVIQPYAWGGNRFLAEFLHQTNPENEPMAELWMGAHPKGPAQINGADKTLDQLITDTAVETLGERVASRFDNRLPFLFKILDVQAMLSIQVHPDKASAERGFAQEEASGPERSAPNRNYRDDNHKPELGVALTDFYLLHGFRSENSIRETLVEIPGWDALLPIFNELGVSGLYRHVMEADQETVDELLAPVLMELAGGEYEKYQPEFWAARAVEQYAKDGHQDRGIFSIFWFNVVHLRPGEGIFQDAGIPHAYLEGVCIELMANSDNVLRGGLTPKHIDVPELLRLTNTISVTPNVLLPQEQADGWSVYPTPAPDFRLRVAKPSTGKTLSVDTTAGPAIILLLSGEVKEQDGPLTLTEQDRIAFVPAGLHFSLLAASESVVYLAEVGE
ncbi:mannose-6-phosphate isomerase, class I [Neolewinella agarilytica]|uniref:mannose-6-phosphate isomerase, class I n=1 Tax=Neolewinella agarilytica TaxID=478744 RepID=UPI002352B783|nr:mannose-6-phosphate isomerase, class I [Neolewinella agarilytica]